MNCPLDNTQLQISERNGIEIDYCPKCRGVWLDRGELDKIIERANDSYSSPREDYNAREGYQERGKSYDDDYYKKRKKKSFLDDLFDF